MQLIYVVEDDDSIRELLKGTLESYGYSVIAFEEASDMLAALNQEHPALILLDIMLPGINGIEVLKLLKSNKHTESIPVIMLTAKTLETDKVAGLDLGADDYITKPFGILELTARVRAALRRNVPQKDEKRDFVEIADIVLDISNHEVTKGGIELELTLKEFELLKLLMKSKGRVVSREELLDRIWGYDYLGETRTLDMHIKTLRQKLRDDADNPTYIKTVRAVGYKFIA